MCCKVSPLSEPRLIELRLRPKCPDVTPDPKSPTPPMSPKKRTIDGILRVKRHVALRHAISTSSVGVVYPVAIINLICNKFAGKNCNSDPKLNLSADTIFIYMYLYPMHLYPHAHTHMLDMT